MIFNIHFASQCTPVKIVRRILKLKYKTSKQLTFIEVGEDNILLIMKNLNVNKAQELIKND